MAQAAAQAARVVRAAGQAKREPARAEAVKDVSVAEVPTLVVAETSARAGEALGQAVTCRKSAVKQNQLLNPRPERTI